MRSGSPTAAAPPVRVHRPPPLLPPLSNSESGFWTRVIGYSSGCGAEEESGGGVGAGNGSFPGSAAGVNDHEAAFETGHGSTYGYAYVEPPPFPHPQVSGSPPPLLHNEQVYYAAVSPHRGGGTIEISTANETLATFPVRLSPAPTPPPRPPPSGLRQVCAPIVYFPPLPPTATATATQLASLAPDVVVSGLTPPTTGTSPSSSARLPPFVVVTEVPPPPPPPIEYARPPSTEQQEPSDLSASSRYYPLEEEEQPPQLSELTARRPSSSPPPPYHRKVWDMSTPIQQGERGSSVLTNKGEHGSDRETSVTRPTTPTTSAPPPPPPSQTPPAPPPVSSTSSGKKTAHQRNFKQRSKEYIMRRRRNNIAVRKSREKAKHHFHDLQGRERELEESNWKLEMKAESLTRTVVRLKEMWEELKATGYVNEGDNSKALEQADAENGKA